MHVSTMEMKKIACGVIFAAASMTAVMAVEEAGAPAPGPASAASAALPALGSLKEKKKKKEINLQKNESLFLEELIASSGGKYNPIRTFSSRQILQATDNFNMSNAICEDRFVWYKGTIENITVLIKNYNEESLTMIPDNIYRDIAIAREIADAVTYLHTQFPRIIINRDLKLKNIFLDENWTAKLTSFSLSIPIPEGESCVIDIICGTTPHVEPEYTATGFVTENVNVYSLGSMTLSLLIGKSWFIYHPYEDYSYKRLTDYVEECLGQGMFTKLIDPSMLNSVDDNVPDHSRVQMEAFVELALRCLGLRPGEDKPRMIDVAKELKHIEKQT
ncbi:hypothetical protein HID58_035634 [Brassica napus]|uniref:Protein kinase domain-containing protein n=1 Tax=Brassica napus TaxID=3708 RepID=A0ABQ8C5M1_BRANA|nr:hypothetical protein HID58_035634 [Brassica napus]